jgi:hypothetical protein
MVVEMTIRHAPAAEIMGRWQPGSYDTHPDTGAPWTWSDEIADIRSRDELAPLLFSVRLLGILAPALMGDDGRVWGGHHRIVAGHLTGELVPYEVYPDADVATAHELAGM